MQIQDQGVVGRLEGDVLQGAGAPVPTVAPGAPAARATGGCTLGLLTRMD